MHLPCGNGGQSPVRARRSDKAPAESQARREVGVVLAELGIVQAVCSLVAGVMCYLLTSATGAPLDVSVALWCWGVVSGVALFWSWRRGVRARGEQIQLLEAARAKGLLSG
jgi:hypothetical protein